MKYLLIIVLAVLILAAVTKPTDDQCRDQVMRHTTGSDLLTDLADMAGVSRYAVTVEDHIFYKTVHSGIDGHRMAYGVFGNVIIE